MTSLRRIALVAGLALGACSDREAEGGGGSAPPEGDGAPAVEGGGTSPPASAGGGGVRANLANVQKARSLAIACIMFRQENDAFPAELKDLVASGSLEQREYDDLRFEDPETGEILAWEYDATPGDEPGPAPLIVAPTAYGGKRPTAFTDGSVLRLDPRELEERYGWGQ